MRPKLLKLIFTLDAARLEGFCWLFMWYTMWPTCDIDWAPRKWLLADVGPEATPEAGEPELEANLRNIKTIGK